MKSSEAEKYDYQLRQMIMEYGSVMVWYQSTVPWLSRWKPSDSRPFLVQSKDSYKRTPTGEWQVTTTECPQGKYDHASVVVGWTDRYWIVQNSWGTHRGKEGMFYYERINENDEYVNFCGMYFAGAYYMELESDVVPGPL